DDSHYEWLKGEERARIIADVWRLYNAGVPLFTAAQLRDLDQQIARRLKTVTVTGIDGVEYAQNGTFLPRASREEKAFISFSSIEALVSRPPEWPYSRSVAYCPLHISHRRSDDQELNSVEETNEAFIKYKQEWESSEPCRILKHTLASGPLPKSITKIVCFGLGPLTPLNDRSQRVHTQHAAALTMAHAIKERTGCTVQIYSQEPAYTRICEQVLGPHGITILTGVQGFLEVDNSTVVFSVAPNVPVKQIVVDLARPAIMVWDNVESVEEERRVWTKRPSRPGFGESWLSPYGTNPDSPRVRSMVQNEYVLFPFAQED
ncbi:hypothetical protein BKA56DRAFT_430017, partial [Ilyonectria sp. MPI-CAGE-AT-0026]